jgi:hypothetical protein
VRLLALLMAVVVLAVACSAGTTDGSNTGEIAATEGSADVSGIESVEIDGVWVFRHEPEVSMDALHSGTPEIVNGCLMIDNTVVVWHPDTLEDAAAAIAAAKAGDSPQLLISGGGISVSEGADPTSIPDVISDRCPTDAVWFGAP